MSIAVLKILIFVFLFFKFQNLKSKCKMKLNLDYEIYPFFNELILDSTFFLKYIFLVR